MSNFWGAEQNCQVTCSGLTMRPSKICIDPTLYENASYKTVEGILRRGRDSNSWYRITRTAV